MNTTESDLARRTAYEVIELGLGNAKMLQERVNAGTYADNPPMLNAAIDYILTMQGCAYRLAGMPACQPVVIERQRILAVLLEAQDRTCPYCGAIIGREAQIDHIHPHSKGGEDEWQNLAACCSTCNQSKGAKLLGAWIIETGRDAELIAARLTLRMARLNSKEILPCLEYLGQR